MNKAEIIAVAKPILFNTEMVQAIEATEIIRQEKNIKVVIKKQEPKRDGCQCYGAEQAIENIIDYLNMKG